MSPISSSSNRSLKPTAWSRSQCRIRGTGTPLRRIGLRFELDDSVTIRTIVFDGHVLGYVANFERLGKPEVCYWLGNEYWGKGSATAALSRFLTEIEVRPLYAGVAEDNLASIRVLEKCGFVVVEHKRCFAKARGKEIEEVVMRLG